MKIQINFSALSKTRWHEYAVRFVFGGLVTAIAGIIAKEFGPVIGGLFLAFPAIFPASATLIEKHEKEGGRRQGLPGTARAADAVSVDASGAAIGSIALALFAVVIWRAVPNHSAGLVLGGATAAWLAVSVLLWAVRERFWGSAK